MIKVCMNNSVTIMKDLSAGKMIVETFKYKDFPHVIANINEMVVDYYYGQRNKRVKLLTGLGFKLKETIWFNDEELYSKIKQIWSR